MNQSFTRQQEARRREARKRTMPLREYWHLYLSLVGTAILTAFAGIYLGLAPSQTGEIVFLSTWDMLRRIFFALYYAASFILVAEGATLFAKDKLLQRDVEEDEGKTVDIPAQRNSMTAMLWVSVLAIVGTTVAAGYILAAWLGALDQFVTIPAAAQTWVVLAPPALLVFDAVMALIYQQNSKESELDRWLKQQKRMADAQAQEAWGREYVNAYSSVAPAAARKAARASAMNDARKWAGGAVDDYPDVEKEARPVMEEPKELKSYHDTLAKMPPAEFEEERLGAWGGPDATGPQVASVVMEENTMTEPEVPAQEPAPDQEVGTDQPSPT